MNSVRYRAWNKDKDIMVYLNEDDSAGYWDGVHCSDVEMVNYRLQNKSYVWQRYTGLRDKNAVPIYERDIVKYTRVDYTDCSRTEVENIHEPIIGEMYYAEGLWLGIKYKDGTGTIFRPGLVTSEELNEELEVIGNVFNMPDWEF